jgi:hypothetical protein
MLATYGTLLVILTASCLVGQALFALCGRREWSWLAPPVGLAMLTAVAWGTVRVPGEGVASAVAIAALAAGSLTVVRGRVAGLGPALGIGVPVAVAATVAASLPFLVEGRFGILGTGLNPDMSQHLFAADGLAQGEGGRLLDQGYPLGPHALAVATSEGTGASLVHAFGGLTLAIGVIAVLAPLAVLERLSGWRRASVALLVGLPYLVASYLIQGAFKETMEALFVLAFALALHELSRGALARNGEESPAPLAAVPLAALAAGAAYSYSFAGLLWPLGAVSLWALWELALAARRDSRRAALALARRAAPAVAVAVAALALAVAPEVGRMINFASFETFDPQGPGLGNLFNPISPLEALGIWPSGDFRLDPGDGAIPAAGFYLGEALGLAALAYGLAWWLLRAERALPAALAAAAALFAYAHFAGTPYQAAKAIVIASPLAMLIAARALLSTEPLIELGGLRGAIARRRNGIAGILVRHQRALRLALSVAFLGAAAVSSALALVNGPVGPATYSPALTELRPALGRDSTLVLASERMLASEHGRDYLVWELRGGRVCVEPAASVSAAPPPFGASHVITEGPPGRPPFAGLRLARRAGPYALWRVQPAPREHGSCPLISVGGRADPDVD